MTASDVGAALKAVRQEAGLSANVVAHRAGLDHSYLSRIEAGRRLPSRPALLFLLDAIGLEHEGRDRLLLLAGYRPESDVLAEVSAAWAECGDPQRRALGLDLLRSACTVLRGTE